MPVPIIKGVDGRAIPSPSTFVYYIWDISSEDAGRTEDTTMQKNRIGQTVKIDLAWQNLSSEQMSEILRAFNPEYIFVEYFDLMENAYVTKEFTVGNRTAPLYSSYLERWEKLSFSITERTAKEFDTGTNTWVTIQTEGEE